MTKEQRSAKFIEAFEPHRESLWRFVKQMVGNNHVAEDVMQETILQALEGMHRLKDADSLKSVLFTIASRIVKRQRFRKKLFGWFDEQAAEELHDTRPLPDSETDAAILRESLEILPRKIRESIVLFYVLDLSLAEIQKIQGGTTGGVKTRLHRGRAMLSAHLGLNEAPALSEPPKSPISKTIQHQTVL
ncbi:MAG: RNA polymerase sigma factor [Ignavibacteria bacterium]|nr:RNA polymerase sigma factor [Ignavibacteria bacterium]